MSITRKKEDIQNEVKFRMWFRDEFNIDYLEAIDQFNKRKEESDNRWKQVLLENNLI